MERQVNRNAARGAAGASASRPRESSLELRSRSPSTPQTQAQVSRIPTPAPPKATPPFSVLADACHRYHQLQRANAGLEKARARLLERSEQSALLPSIGRRYQGLVDEAMKKQALAAAEWEASEDRLQTSETESLRLLVHGSHFYAELQAEKKALLAAINDLNTFTWEEGTDKAAKSTSEKELVWKEYEKQLNKLLRGGLYEESDGEVVEWEGKDLELGSKPEPKSDPKDRKP